MAKSIKQNRYYLREQRREGLPYAEALLASLMGNPLDVREAEQYLAWCKKQAKAKASK